MPAVELFCRSGITGTEGNERAETRGNERAAEAGSAEAKSQRGKKGNGFFLIVRVPFPAGACGRVYVKKTPSLR